MQQPLLQNILIGHLCQRCNLDARYYVLHRHDKFLSICQFERCMPYQLLASSPVSLENYWNFEIPAISIYVANFSQGMFQNLVKGLNYSISLRVIRCTLLMEYLKLLCKWLNSLV